MQQDWFTGSDCFNCRSTGREASKVTVAFASAVEPTAGREASAVTVAFASAVGEQVVSAARSSAESQCSGQAVPAVRDSARSQCPVAAGSTVDAGMTDVIEAAQSPFTSDPGLSSLGALPGQEQATQTGLQQFGYEVQGVSPDHKKGPQDAELDVFFSYLALFRGAAFR